jgi:hypothetical protein
VKVKKNHFAGQQNDFYKIVYEALALILQRQPVVYG